MEPSLFKESVRVILGGNVEFLGPRFDEIVSSLTASVEERLFAWLERVKGRREEGLASKSSYKGYAAHQLLTYRHAFSLSDNKYRVLLVRVKNEWYIEFHLGDHKYYDATRARLGVSRR